MAEAVHLAVARIRKPHGLHGEVVAWVLTDEPEKVLATGRTLVPIDEDGEKVAEELRIERGRPFHRRWLLKFVGIDDRSTVEGWRERLLGAAADELSPPREHELYLHEIPGATVQVEGKAIGVAKELIDAPGGALLAVDVDGRELLVPFRGPIVKRIIRKDRVIELDVPDGLLEL